MKKWALFLLIAFEIILHSASFVCANELTDDYLDIATNYYNENNYIKAREYIDLIISIEPENKEAKVLLQKMISPCPTKSEQINQATAPNQAEDQPCQPSEQVDEPTEQTEQAQMKASEFIVKPIPDKVVYNSDYYNTKGKDFYKKKEFDTAIEYFYKALTVDNKNFQAYNNLAMTFWVKNDPRNAIKYFKKANSVNHFYTQPLVNLASVYKQLGDKKSQLHYLLKAIKINPSDYMAYYWLGDYYRGEGQYSQAIENYKEVVKIQPRFGQAYLNLAICFFETEEFNYALLALKQYNELCPDFDYAYSLSARANLALCNYVDARTYIQKAIELKDSPDYQFTLAQIDYYLEDYQNALLVLQTLAGKSEEADTYNYIGLCNYKLKNINEAIANFQKTIKLQASRPIYYYNLAQCYKSLGDKKNYSKYVSSATKIMPISYQDFIDLSYIYYDNGSAGYAINALNSGISKYPEVKSLYLAKLKMYETIGDTLHYNETKDLIEKKFNNRQSK